jgi:hypothetical protein
MAYPVTVLLVINPPQDYPSWEDAQKLARAEAVVEFHEYIRAYHRDGKIRWAWGSYPLYSAYNSRINLSSFVVVYSAPTMDDYASFMAGCPLTSFATFVTVPLYSLAEDFEEDEKTRKESNVFPAGKEAQQWRRRVQAEYRVAPEYFRSLRELRPINPPNAPVDFDQMDSSGVSYLLYGVGPVQSVNWTDFRRSIYNEKIFWWYAYANNLIRGGKITHGWSIMPFCDVIGVYANCKGGVVVLHAIDLNELTELYRQNPLIEEAEFLSVALRPIAQQRTADAAFADALRTRLRKSR